MVQSLIEAASYQRRYKIVPVVQHSPLKRKHWLFLNYQNYQIAK